MIKTVNWELRRQLLGAIDRDGRKIPLSVLSRKIVSYGASLNLIINELVNGGFVIKLNIGRKVTTRLTGKGERLCDSLNKLDEVLNGL